MRWVRKRPLIAQVLLSTSYVPVIEDRPLSKARAISQIARYRQAGGWPLTGRAIAAAPDLASRSVFGPANDYVADTSAISVLPDVARPASSCRGRKTLLFDHAIGPLGRTGRAAANTISAGVEKVHAN